MYNAWGESTGGHDDQDCINDRYVSNWFTVIRDDKAEAFFYSDRRLFTTLYLVHSLAWHDIALLAQLRQQETEEGGKDGWKRLEVRRETNVGCNEHLGVTLGLYGLTLLVATDQLHRIFRRTHLTANQWRPDRWKSIHMIALQWEDHALWSAWDCPRLYRLRHAKRSCKGLLSQGTLQQINTT